ncbi:hypothetical protein HDU87_004191 [Geranomyces variabilis]|uniref:G-protein coupled receptors family 3 profile domain-containing protein n=1 Tax=Geranomyces variabilis TaxID=109894 RepID=A0AAD5TP97_9FUNG|nr:hypothetical protein HDU87_004191 [Geranomyces variabilis]
MRAILSSIAFLVAALRFANATLPVLKVAVVLGFGQEKYLTATAFEGVQIAVAEINANASMLPGLTLQADEFDDNLMPARVISQAYNLTQRGYSAVIGEEYSSLSTTLNYALSTQNIFQCSAWSTSPLLSDKSNFPTFFRVTPDDNAQGLVMLQFVKQMGWKNAAVLASTDSYSQGISDVLVASAGDYGITLLAAAAYTAGAKDTANLIEKIQVLQDVGARIVFLLCADTDETVLVHRQLRAQGALGADFVYIGGDAMRSVTANADLAADDLANLQGLFTTSPQEYSARTASFKQKFSARNGSAPFDQDNCEGCASHYDAMWALAYGFQNVMLKYGQTPAQMAGNEWFDLDLNITQFLDFPAFEGATQTMSWYPNGDVSTSNFLISNIVGPNQVDIATSTGPVSVVFIPGVAVTFYGGGNTAPLDYPIFTDDVVGFTNAKYDILHAVIALFLGVIVASIPVLYVNRNSTVLRPVSPVFLALACCGMMLSLSSVYVDAIAETTSASCNGFVAMLAVGFGTVVGSILLKLFRLWRIFDNPVAGRQVFSSSKLLVGSGLIICVEILIIAIWWGAFPLRATEISDLSARRRYFKCQSDNSHGQTGLTAVLFIYNAALIVLCCYFAFATRNIYSAFNEAKAIGIAIYNILFCIIITGIVSFMGSTTVATSFVIRTIVILFAVIVTWIAVVGRFIYALVLKIDPEKFGLSNGSGSASASGGGGGGGASSMSISGKLNNMVRKTSTIGRASKPLMAPVKIGTLHCRGSSAVTTSQWRKFNLALTGAPVGLLTIIKDADPSKSLALPLATLSVISHDQFFKVSFPKGMLTFQGDDFAAWAEAIQGAKDGLEGKVKPRIDDGSGYQVLKTTEDAIEDIDIV